MLVTSFGLKKQRIEHSRPLSFTALLSPDDYDAGRHSGHVNIRTEDLKMTSFAQYVTFNICELLSSKMATGLLTAPFEQQ